MKLCTLCKTTLQKITTDGNHTEDTRNQANTLAKRMDTKKVAFLCELWNDILQRFNQCSILLQSSSIELTNAVSCMKSLNQFVT